MISRLRLISRNLTVTSQITNGSRGPFHDRRIKPKKLPDSVKDYDSVNPETWKRDFASVSLRSSTHQFDNQFLSDKFFKEREIWDEKAKQKRKIKLTPGLPFKTRKDPLSGKRAYDGIYDFIDILGDDPSVTPHQLCHGHPSYRAVDLGVQIQARDQTSGDPRKHVAELRTLHNVTSYKRRHQYGRVENLWRRRYMKRVEWLNRINAQLHG